MYWIGAIVAIGVLIVVHEAGHFFVARWCKMRVDRFSVGFGPAIWSRKKGDTVFQIAPIPFGGYVQINGMLVADEIEPDDPHAYPNRPAWQRFVTIFAGPATNYLFAIVLAVIFFSVAGVETNVRKYCEISSIEKGSDAVGKLEQGDRIVGIELYDGDKIIYQGRLQKSLGEYVQIAQDNPIKFRVESDGPDGVKTRMVEVHAHKVEGKDGNPMYLIGVRHTELRERRDVGIIASVGYALYYPIDQTQQIVSGLFKVITGEEKGELTGPVGITSVIKDSIEAGWLSLVRLLMILNVYLGLFNLFPLPALDGGRLVFLGYEMATRRRANPKVEATVHMVGIMALLVVMVLVTYKDIAKLL